MPVVINEFEIQPDPEAPPSPSGSDQKREAPPANEPDLEPLLQLRWEREARVRAH